ncbi:hypothetical protein WKT22_03688 [Candidatus Lokiarchaeum ossiferum]
MNWKLILLGLAITTTMERIPRLFYILFPFLIGFGKDGLLRE